MGKIGTRVPAGLIAVILVVLAILGWKTYEYVDKLQVKRATDIAYEQEHENLRKWGETYNAIEMDNQIYSHLKERDFTRLLETS